MTHVQQGWLMAKMKAYTILMKKWALIWKWGHFCNRFPKSCMCAPSSFSFWKEHSVLLCSKSLQSKNLIWSKFGSASRRIFSTFLFSLKITFELGCDASARSNSDVECQISPFSRWTSNVEFTFHIMMTLQMKIYSERQPIRISGKQNGSP